MNVRLTLSVAVASVLSGVASGAIYDLADDFSEVANPNGTWSFTRGADLLNKFTSSNPNAINAVAANGFWGVGAASNYESSILKTTGNGVDAAGYTNNDFLLGDILVHGTNPGGAPILITWTAPEAGDLSVSGSTWYAHSIVTRSQDFSLSLNNSVLASGTLTNATNRPNALAFSSGGVLSVVAGDRIVFRVTPTAGQTFASIAGLDLAVDFTPIPAPASLALVGLGSLVATRRRA
jgi:hypothetical protein